MSMGLQTMAYETFYFNSLRVWTTSPVHSLALPESTAVLVAQQPLPFPRSSLKGMNTGQQKASS